MVNPLLLTAFAEIIFALSQLPPQNQSPPPQPVVVDYSVLGTIRNHQDYRFTIVYAINGYSNDLGALTSSIRTPNKELFEMIKTPSGNWLLGHPLSGKVTAVATHPSPQVFLITSTNIYLWHEQANKLILVFTIPANFQVTKFRATTRHHEILDKNNNFAGLLSFKGSSWHIIPYQGQHKGYSVSSDTSKKHTVVITLSSGKRISFYPIIEIFSDH